MEYFEDVQVGTVDKFGSKLVNRDEVIEFAGKYDPQPFHLDDAAAAKTYFGRLSASGWHTAAMTMRMMVDHFTQHQRASLGSPGMDELRWIKPVDPGDTLRVENEILGKRRSSSRPEMGLIDTITRVYNQDDIVVMSMKSVGLIQVRDPSAPIEET